MELDVGLLERVAQRFRRDMWESVASAAVTESGIEVERFGPVQATAFAEVPDVADLNQIQGGAEEGAVSGGHLAEAIEWMRAWEVDYRISIAEDRPESAAAEQWLGSRGYELGDGWLTFVRDTSPPRIEPHPEIMIWALGDNDIDGEGLSTLVSEAMGLPMTAESLFYSIPHHPRWRSYTASLPPDENIAATASMMLHEGVAQFGPGGTLDHARGRGCNMALLQRRLVDAIEAGCHTIFAEVWDCRPERLSGVARNLVRAGFEQAYAVRNWQRPALRPAATKRLYGSGG